MAKAVKRSSAKAKTKRKTAAKKAKKVVKKKAAAKKTKKAVLPKPRSPVGAGGATAQDLQDGSVSIRMYRGLLGDFFLVQHKVAGQPPFRMLIDCGVLQCIGSPADKPSTSRGKDRIRAGVDNLIKETGGTIDLVVATHEHYDHLSGFILASDAFKDLKISKVWMAWTEDRADSIANGYRDKKNKGLTALAALARNPALAAADTIATVANLLQFYGDVESIQAGSMGVAKTADGRLAGNASCEMVLEWLRQKAGPGNVSFLKPGQVVNWGVGGAFRAFVLGPPRDHDRLKKLNPSKGDAREVYLTSESEVETVRGLAAVHGGLIDSPGLDGLPFAKLYSRPYRAASGGRITGARGTRLSDPVVTLYQNTPSADRIEDAWLGSAETLALKIDGDVNNTSLALAFEAADQGILLFPADAQVGNWLSWGDQKYPEQKVSGDTQLTIEDILGRTVFYKVGHHASHNATARERGLELMADERLCAMIPLVEKTAREQTTKSAPNGWAMPFAELNKRLKEKTKGRILRGDGNAADESASFKGSLFGVPQYGPDFKAGDPLWVELRLSV